MSHDRDVVDVRVGASPRACVLVGATLAAPLSWLVALGLSLVLEDVGRTLQMACAAGAACLVLAGHLVSIFALVTGLFAALPVAAKSAVGVLGVGYWAALLASFAWLATTTGETRYASAGVRIEAPE